MTYRSPSRGILYTAPPSGDDSDRDVRSEESTAAAPEVSVDETGERKAADDPERTAVDADCETAALDSTTGTTDANWTGTVPADD